MAIIDQGSLVHWNYFLALESDLATISRYIEFAESNFCTYSVELARLLLASSSEVDVVLKLYCNQLLYNEGKKHYRINDYRKTIQSHSCDIINEEVKIPRFGLILHPWDNWNKKNKNPYWWTSYNNVKHQRGDHFDDANLKNTLNSIAGLFLVNAYYYSSIHGTNIEHFFEQVSNPSLLKLSENYYPVFRVI